MKHVLHTALYFVVTFSTSHRRILFKFHTAQEQEHGGYRKIWEQGEPKCGFSPSRERSTNCCKQFDLIWDFSSLLNINFILNFRIIIQREWFYSQHTRFETLGFPETPGSNPGSAPFFGGGWAKHRAHVYMWERIFCSWSFQNESIGFTLQNSPCIFS